MLRAMETRNGTASAEGVVLRSADLRTLVRLVRDAVRPMVRRRHGRLVCVVPHPPSADLPGTVEVEAATAVVRSVAADLSYYGVAVSGVVEVDDAPAGTQVAGLLAGGEVDLGTGEVYLVSRTGLARLAPPAADQVLLRSGHRITTAEAAATLTPWAGASPPRGSGGRVAIVTGGGGGIGRAVAEGLAADGAAVVVADLGCDPDGAGRDPGPAEGVVREIAAQGGQAVAACVDVSQPADCDELVALALRRFGRVDALVHAAGVVRPALVFELTDEDWDTVHAVHVTGARNLVHSALPAMRRQRHGRVVLLSSRSVTGSPGQVAYAAAKGAVLGYARSLAAELAGTGIGVTAVLPSGRTRASAPDRPSTRRRRIELLRARHHGIADPAAYRASPQQDPENNAAMVGWLCGEAAGTVSGRVFGTGGWSVELYRPTTVAAAVDLPATLTAEQLGALGTG